MALNHLKTFFCFCFLITISRWWKKLTSSLRLSCAMGKSLSLLRNWPPTLHAAGMQWGASELGSNTGHSSEKCWGIFGWSAKHPPDYSELLAAQSALRFCLKDPSPCKYDFSVHDQKHLLEFQGAFSLMQSTHFYMIQHKNNFLAFALCCVKGTLMEMLYLNPKCWRSLN